MKYLWVVTLALLFHDVKSDVSCSSGLYSVGSKGFVRCHFGRDVRQAGKLSLLVVHCGNTACDAFSQSPLACNIDQGKVECTTPLSGYTFDEQVDSSLTLVIPNVTEQTAGVYFCQVNPSDDSPIHCNLTLIDNLPVTPAPSTDTTVIIDHGTGGHAQEGVIVGLSGGLVASVVLSLLITACVVFVWYKYDLVKRTERGDSPDGWTKYIICCKLCKCLPCKRPLGVSSRDYPDSNMNTRGERQSQPDRDAEGTPLLIIENENYRNSVGSGVGEGACSGVDDRDNIDGYVGEGTVTVEVAPVTIPESQQNPDAAAEDENPKDDFKLDKDEKEVTSQNAPPGNDTNIVPAAAKYKSSDKAPGLPTRPDRYSEPRLSSARRGNQAPGNHDLASPLSPAIPLDKHLSHHIHKVDPDKYEPETISGKGNGKSASPSPDGTLHAYESKTPSFPKPITSGLVRPSKFVPSSRMAGRTHGGQKPDDKLGPAGNKNKSQPLIPPVTFGEHPPSTIPQNPLSSHIESNTDNKVNATTLPLPDEEYPPVDDFLPSQDTKKDSQTDDHDVADDKDYLDEGSGATKPEGSEDTKQGSGDTKQEGSGDTNQEGSGDTKSQWSGDTKQDDSGDTKQDDSGDTKQDDSGDTKQDDSGDTKQDDSGDTKQDDSGDTNQEGSGDTKSQWSGDTKSQWSGDTKSQWSGDTKSQWSGDTKSQWSGDTKSQGSGDTKQDDSGVNKQGESGATNPDDIEKASNDEDRDDEQTTDNSASITSQENQNADTEENKDLVTPLSAESESKRSPDTGSPESSGTSGTSGVLGWLWGNKKKDN